MSWNNIKRDPADIVFSQYIRLKHKKCMNCGRVGTGDKGIDGLQASHFHSRRKETVRFDEENVDVLCIACHRKLGTDDKQAYKEFKKKQLGQRGYDLLELRANTTGKKDRKMALIYYREKLRELESQISKSV